MLMISILEQEKKKQHSHAHSLLRECLKTHGICYDENTAVVKNEYGKPSLAERPDICYNLSHSEGICTCIVTDRECGIDCEKVREYRPNVVRRVFSESETADLERIPENERSLYFFRLWTLKEAFVKAVGKGISYPMKEVVFGFDNGRIICSEKGYSFRQYIIRGGEYVVSVCKKNKKTAKRSHGGLG